MITKKASKDIISENILDKNILFIGIDGASKRLIDKMIKDGDLPVLSKLIRTGAYFRSESFDPPMSPVIWTSIATGKKAEKHGIRNFYDTTYSLTAKRIWEIFNDLGHPVGVLGYFATWPPKKVNGFMIPDILALDKKCFPEKYGFMWELIHDAKNENQVNFKKKINYLWQAYANNIKLSTLMQTAALIIKKKVFLKDMQDVFFSSRVIKTQYHRDLFIHLMKTIRPKCAFLHIHLLDTSSHRYWKYIEPKLYENISESEIKKHGNKIAAAYCYVDSMIDNILSHADKNTLIIIASDHGFKGANNKDTQHWTENVTVKINNFQRIVDEKGELNFSIVFPNISVSTRNGNVEKSEYLKEYLQSIEIAENSMPLFKIDEIRTGDIILKFNEEIDEISGKHLAINNKLFPVEELLIRKQDFTSGIHDSSDGILILNGLGVRQNLQSSTSVSIYDIAPTILNLCNMPVGMDMDGKVITDAIEDEHLRRYPVRYIETYENSTTLRGINQIKNLSDMENETLKEQLKSLGYL